MNDRHSDESNDAQDLDATDRDLVDRLRADAEAARPEFSAELHDRICARLDTTERSDVLDAPPDTRVARWWARRAWWSMAALLTIATTIVIVWSNRAPDVTKSTSLTPDPLAGLETLASASGDAVTDIGAAVASVLAFDPWEDLEHDARVAADLLLDQLPLGLLESRDSP